VEGNVVSFGLADTSGHGDHTDKLRPKCVEALARARVKDVSAGLYHSLVATKDGGLLSFGFGSGMVLTVTLSSHATLTGASWTC
jgi:alpha-tubulin suppressor-like RCC1 family protein